MPTPKPKAKAGVRAKAGAQVEGTFTRREGNSARRRRLARHPESAPEAASEAVPANAVVAGASPGRTPSPGRTSALATRAVRFATPLRDPTPPRLRADELAASLLREADAELRGGSEDGDRASSMDVDSLPRLPGAGGPSPVRGVSSDAAPDAAPARANGKSKAKSKGKQKGKSKGKGKDNGTSKKGKKGRGDVIPPPGNF